MRTQQLILTLALFLLPHLPVLGAQCTTSCQFGTCAYPATAAEPPLWGTFEPIDTEQLPANRDSTDFSGDGPFESNPWWIAIDGVGSRVATASNLRLQWWGTHPLRILHDIPLSSSGLGWNPDAHAFEVFTSVAISRDGAAVAYGGTYGVGTAFYSVEGSGLQLSGQLRGPERNAETLAVTAARAGTTQVFLSAGRHLAPDGGVVVTTTAGLPLYTFGSWLEVPDVDAVGDLAIVSSGLSSGGYSIWRLHSDHAELLTQTDYAGHSPAAAIWKTSQGTYAAYRTSTAVVVARLQSAGSSWFLEHVTEIQLPPLDARVLRASTIDEKLYLFAGRRDWCLTGAAHEWLWTLDAAEELHDLYPSHQVTLGGRTTSYRQHYYRPQGGFNRMRPADGVVLGDPSELILYRAGGSLLDSHRIRSEPVLSLDVTPDPAFQCQTVRVKPPTTTASGQTFAWSLTTPDGSTSQTTAPRLLLHTDETTPLGIYRVSTEVDLDGQPQTLGASFPLGAAGPVELAPSIRVQEVRPGTIQFAAEDLRASEWAWTFGDGTTRTYASASKGRGPLHSYDHPGRYTATVTASNCVGHSQTATVTFDVLDGSPPAIASADILGVPCTTTWCTARTGDVLQIDLTTSGLITQFAYDWNGDGDIDQVSDIQVSEFTFEHAGNYSVRVTATGPYGNSTLETPLLLVSGASFDPPPQPTEPTFATSGSVVNVSWAPQPNTLAHRLHYRSLGGPWDSTSLLPRDQLTWSLPPLPLPLEIQLEARNTVGSTFSPIATITTPRWFAEDWESGAGPPWTAAGTTPPATHGPGYQSPRALYACTPGRSYVHRIDAPVTNQLTLTIALNLEDFASDSGKRTKLLQLLGADGHRLATLVTRNLGGNYLFTLKLQSANGEFARTAFAGTNTDWVDLTLDYARVSGSVAIGQLTIGTAPPLSVTIDNPSTSALEGLRLGIVGGLNSASAGCVAIDSLTAIP